MIRASWRLAALVVPLAVGACAVDSCGNPVGEGAGTPSTSVGRDGARREGSRSGVRAKPVALSPGGERPPGEQEAWPPLHGKVVKIVDGDTIYVRIDGRAREKVRYIGVDTPETKHPRIGVEPFGPEASALNRALLEGRRVELRFDRRLRDRYGRLLAYVYRESDGLFVNAELVRRGLAEAMRVPPNVRYAARFEVLEQEARAARRGMWSVRRGPGE